MSLGEEPGDRMELLLHKRVQHRLMAAIALVAVLLCALPQFLPGLWPASTVAWLGMAHALQVVRWFAAGVIALAMIRQWHTVLREPFIYLLVGLVSASVASFLTVEVQGAIAGSQSIQLAFKLTLVLAYAGLAGAVLALPARVDVARDHVLIAIDAMLIAVAVLALVWLYFIMPGGDDSIRGGTAKELLARLRSHASLMLDVLLLLVLLAKPRSSKTGALRGIYGGMTLGTALVLLGDMLTVLSARLPNSSLLLLAGLARRCSAPAFLYAGLRALPLLKDWAPARPAPVEQRLSVFSTLATIVLLVVLFFEQLDHFNAQLILLTVGATVSAVLLLLRQTLMQRRRNIWTAKQRSELERQVAERTAELAAAKSRLEQLASEDPLTQLPNRRAFDEALGTAWPTCARAGQPLSLALLDIDHFKAYNDHYGHAAGDACLQLVANVLRRVVRRRTDLVARYGGEEFLLLMPQTDAAGAELFAERVRAAIEEAALPHAASPVAACLTVSIGVVTVQPDPVSLPESLFFAADAALYAGKAEGRNCVRVGKA